VCEAKIPPEGGTPAAGRATKPGWVPNLEGYCKDQLFITPASPSQIRLQAENETALPEGVIPVELWRNGALRSETNFLIRFARLMVLSA
jgi:hypothetical protein